MQGSLEYRKGDLVKEMPVGGYLLHSCNARGIWGSGIAKQIKEKYPQSFKEYNTTCLRYLKEGDTPVGEYFITSENIICLFTSYDYGKKVDSPKQILLATESALSSLVLSKKDIEIHSPKINSGLFGVPWEQTEQIIIDVLALFPNKGIRWIVWELE
jgi:ADP-ribose 1''-phosphate phosphatase